MKCRQAAVRQPVSRLGWLHRHRGQSKPSCRLGKAWQTVEKGFKHGHDTQAAKR